MIIFHLKVAVLLRLDLWCREAMGKTCTFKLCVGLSAEKGQVKFSSSTNRGLRMDADGDEEHQELLGSSTIKTNPLKSIELIIKFTITH